jgi:hypothetical protein
MELKDYLSQIKKVPGRSLPYYLLRIQQYQFFRDSNPDKNTQVFLSGLDHSCQPWQVDQARRAIRYYHSFSDGIGHEDVTPEPAGAPISWVTVNIRSRDELRLQHKSYQTEKAYLSWLRRFERFLKSRPVTTLGGDDVRDFLTYLAVQRQVSFSTQKQAFNALLFVFRYILDKPIGSIDEVPRSKTPRKLPVVLTAEEINRIFAHLSGIHRLMAMLIYGSGLRLVECRRYRCLCQLWLKKPGDIQPRFFMTGHRITGKLTVPWSVEPGFISVHLEL